MRHASLLCMLTGAALLTSATSTLAQNSFTEVDLVSDVAGRASITDPNLVNPWGLVPGPSGVFWSSNNATGTSTLYQPDGTIVPLVVSIPNGGNTGVALTDPAAAAFEIPSADTTARAIFIFVSENGAISAWSNRVDPTHAITVATTADANYKGIALARTPSGPRLYAANFSSGAVDVFDRHFSRVMLPGAFVDPNLPSGYGAFNIANIGGRLFVSYAQQDVEHHDNNSGPGLGFIDVYDLDGVFLRRLVSQGPLNAPWGMVLAPPTFGPFGDNLLVGNFGDGLINIFSLTTGAFGGSLQDALGHPIAISGLWGLHFGRAVSGAQVANRLYFAAGPEDESHGLFGYLKSNGHEECSNRAVDAEFWREQLERGEHGRGHGRSGHKIGADSLAALFACVGSFSGPFGPAGCFIANADLLKAHGRLDERTRVAQAFLALELDRCAGFICDSAVVDCHIRSGHGDEDGDDDDGDKDHGHGQGRGHGNHFDGHHGDRKHPVDTDPVTVADIVAMIDSSLCSVHSGDSLEALASLTECAIRSGQGLGKHDDDDLISSTGDSKSPQADVQVQTLGTNPVRLSSGLGARFVLTTPATSAVRFGIYDVNGRLVAELLRGAPVTGSTVLHWDGTNLQGSRVAAGTYFYRAIAGQTVAGGRIVVLH